MRLAALEAPGGGLHQLSDKDRRLASLLSRLAHRYDCCLIDCPPTVGLLTFNALRAAREALIPVETGFFAWRGAEKQWSTIQRVIEHIGRPIACHLMATLFKPQSKLARTILASLRRQFAGQILPVVIREHDLLREAASYGQPIIDYAADSDACDDYEQLAEWLCEHATGPPAVEVEVMARHPRLMGGNELEQITAGPQIEGPPDPMCYQSNAEHELINFIHAAQTDGTDFIIINPGALTHTSIALRDAFLGVSIPFIEVHLSNLFARETYRQNSYLSDIAIGVISGMGAQGYSLALQAMEKKLNESN